LPHRKQLDIGTDGDLPAAFITASPAFIVPESFFYLEGMRLGYENTVNRVAFFTLDMEMLYVTDVEVALPHVTVYGAFPPRQFFDQGRYFYMQLFVDDVGSELMVAAKDTGSSGLEAKLDDGIIAFLVIVTLAAVSLITFVYSSRILDGVTPGANINYAPF